jgi:hypothetical protein
VLAACTSRRFSPGGAHQVGEIGERSVRRLLGVGGGEPEHAEQVFGHLVGRLPGIPVRLTEQLGQGGGGVAGDHERDLGVCDREPPKLVAPLEVAKGAEAPSRGRT